MIEHSRLYEELFSGKKNFAIMQKHIRAYISGFDGAKDLRKSLVDLRNTDDLQQIIEAFFKGQLPLRPDSD